MQTSMGMFTVLGFDPKCLFWVYLVQKFKFVCSGKNLLPRLIRICRTQWRCSLHQFYAGNTLFGQVWSKKNENCQFQIWRTQWWFIFKWLGVRLRTKWLWVRIPLLSLKLQISCLLRARSSLTFRQTIKCGFTLKLVRDMIITYSLLASVLDNSCLRCSRSQMFWKIGVFKNFVILTGKYLCWSLFLIKLTPKTPKRL